MKTYYGKPKARAARLAWETFTRDAGSEPVTMSFGYAQHYGNSWTADIETSGLTDIWLWQASWAKATCVYGPAQRARGIAIG